MDWFMCVGLLPVPFLLQIYSSLNCSPQGHVLVVLHTHTHALLLWPGQTTNSVFNTEQKQLTGCGLFPPSLLSLPVSIYLTAASCFSLKTMLEVLHHAEGGIWTFIFIFFCHASVAWTNRNVSTTIKPWVADIHLPQRMNPSDFFWSRILLFSSLLVQKDSPEGSNGPCSICFMA